MIPLSLKKYLSIEVNVLFVFLSPVNKPMFARFRVKSEHGIGPGEEFDVPDERKSRKFDGVAL